MNLSRFEFRLHKDDWEKHPRGDEWFLFDTAALFDSTATQLAELEKAMGGYRIGVMLTDMREAGAQALRAAYWVARRQAGVRESFAAFDPRVLRVEVQEPDELGDDADPPDSALPEPSLSSPDSRPDTSAPTTDPGSPASTQESDPATSAT